MLLTLKSDTGCDKIIGEWLQNALRSIFSVVNDEHMFYYAHQPTPLKTSEKGQIWFS